MNPRDLIDDRLNDLGPGSPNLAVRPRLQQFAAELPDNDFARAALAGLWLLHDFSDESHSISQDLDTLEGSYWHGILHRREPDYWNAKYWFRRVPTHPVFAELCKRATTLANDAGTPAGSAFLITQAKWDAAAFVDLCEQAAQGTDATAMLCRQIQRTEWDLLFNYCWERARGA